MSDVRTTQERINSKVAMDPMSGCHLWIGAANASGYGQMHHDGKTAYAHRVNYELHKGKIPDGLALDHLCRVPCCVNPAHLEPVSFRENVLRGIGPSAREAKQTHCIHGHPLSGENLYLRKDMNGRHCKTCHRERQRLPRYQELRRVRLGSKRG